MVWIVCAMLATALAAGSAVPATADENVAGEWKGEYTALNGSNRNLYLTLKQEGESVTGTLFIPAAARNRPVNRELSGTFKDGVFVSAKTREHGPGDTMTGTFPSTDGGRVLGTTARRTKK